MIEHTISRELFQEAIEEGIKGLQTRGWTSYDIPAIAGALRNVGETADRALVKTTVYEKCGCPMAKIGYGHSSLLGDFALPFDCYICEALDIKAISLENTDGFRVLIKE